MGMNFQDQPSEEKSQPKQSASNFDDPKVDDIFIDSPSGGAKILWIALAVVVFAGIVGGLFLMNKYGYLKFLHKRPAISVVSQAPPPAAAPTNTAPSTPATASSTTDRFAVQVSAFRTKPMADKYAAKLKQKGIDAYVLAGEVPNEGTWFKVCVGSYDTKLRAIAATEDLKQKVGTDVWVVPAQ
jgi:SPOR domain